MSIRAFSPAGSIGRGGAYFSCSPWQSLHPFYGCCKNQSGWSSTEPMRSKKGGGVPSFDRTPRIGLTEETEMCRASRAWIALLLSVLVVMTGCSKSPEARKTQHLERGDKYFAKAQFREAIIEYTNVIRIDVKNARAYRQIALAHYELGELGQALPYLMKSQELDPEDLDARLKLGSIYLLARQPAKAREQVTTVLEKDPANFEALLLWAATARTRQEVDAAILRLEEARAQYGDKAKLHMSLGELYFKKNDLVKAERALQEAVAKETKSVDAHTLLGNLYLMKRDIGQAEREYRAAAELGPAGSPTRLKLADFYFSFGKPEEGRRILVEMTEKAPDFLPAWRRLAEVALNERKYDESIKALEAVFKRSPSDLEGHFLRGKVHLAKGETTQAIEEFQKVLKLEPRFASARHQLALAYLRTGNVQSAKAALKEATTANPNFTEAVLLQAELDIQTGAVQPAIEALEQLVAKQPNEARGYLGLGAAYLAKRDPAKAAEAYRKVVALAPKDPRGPHYLGIALRMQGKTAEAKREFEASLALAPGYVEPLAQLVSVAFAEKKPDLALERVQRQITLVPNSGELQFLLGEVHRARGDLVHAETAYLKALELQPDRIGPYLRLGDVYARKGNYDQALAKLEGAVRVNPVSLTALMLSGVIYEKKGDFAKAQAAFEKALAINPRFAPAANNLAYILSVRGGDKEKALQLAQMAKEASPDDPSISDTLGWILYNRGVYQRSLVLLKESAAKLPENPEVQYHLGMAALKVGDTETARKSLAAAIAAPANFVGKDEARQALAQLK